MWKSFLTAGFLGFFKCKKLVVFELYQSIFYERNCITFRFTTMFVAIFSWNQVDFFNAERALFCKIIFSITITDFLYIFFLIIQNQFFSLDYTASVFLLRRWYTYFSHNHSNPNGFPSTILLYHVCTGDFQTFHDNDRIH